jgi:uncharacterized protein YdaU (DUF1376 family)
VKRFIPIILAAFLLLGGTAWAGHKKSGARSKPKNHSLKKKAKKKKGKKKKGSKKGDKSEVKMETEINKSDVTLDWKGK